MTEQSAIISKNLDAIENICDALMNPQDSGQYLVAAITALLDQDEKLDATGALAADINDGRLAVQSLNPAAGIDAVSSARAKLV